MTTVGFSELDVMMVEFMMQFQKYMNVGKNRSHVRSVTWMWNTSIENNELCQQSRGFFKLIITYPDNGYNPVVTI